MPENTDTINDFLDKEWQQKMLSALDEMLNKVIEIDRKLNEEKEEQHS